MKSPLNTRLRFTPFILFFAALLGLGATQAYAVSTVVRYDPPSHGVFGVLPASDAWQLDVIAPGSGVAFPVTVTLRLECTDSPLGDFLTPRNYIHFSAQTLTFAAPGEKQSVTVTADFPASALTMDVTAGTYAYKIYTDGWGAGITDNGALINASVSTVFPPPGNAPATTIDAPEEGHVFTFAPSELPQTIPFLFHATTDDVSPLITEVSAAFGPEGGATVPVTTTITGGLGTTLVNASGSFIVTAPGRYILQAGARNLIGTGTDMKTYVVVIQATGPTAQIVTPTPGSNYTYRLGDAPAQVPFEFSAHSNYGGIRTLVAYVDNLSTDFIPVGIGSLDAHGSITLSYTAAGAHTVSIIATDDYGSATAQSNFTINVVGPTPTLTITNPVNSAVFTIPVGSTTIDVPYAFTTTSNNGFVVDSVTAAIGTTPIAPVTNGLATATANSTGTLAGLTTGTYTLTATGISSGISVQKTVTFKVEQAAANPPPTVAINTPAPNATYTRYLNGPALYIPLTFTGTSNATNGVITQVTATLDGVSLAVSAVLNTKVVVATANMTVSASGTHTIVVTAKDAYGTATASQTFKVVVLEGSTISGTIFFDLDTDGSLDASEFGLAGITVKLRTATGQNVATTTTAIDGSYGFTKVPAGNYIVSATAYNGLTATTGSSRAVTVNNVNVSGVNIGFMIDFCGLQGMTASGFTIGYWKNNLDKALKGTKSGVQVSAATLSVYTTAIGSFAFSPYDNITMKAASSVMASTSSAPADLLSKQLLAAEYNYENKAYLNGNGTLTLLFVSWGEYVLSNPSKYSTTYVLWAKDWFDAYNNSHGGAVSGPALIGTSCTGTSGSASGSDGEPPRSGYENGTCDDDRDHHSGSSGDCGSKERDGDRHDDRDCDREDRDRDDSHNGSGSDCGERDNNDRDRSSKSDHNDDDRDRHR